MAGPWGSSWGGAGGHSAKSCFPWGGERLAVRPQEGEESSARDQRPLARERVTTCGGGPTGLKPLREHS